MEIKVLVTESEKLQLEKFLNTAKDFGMRVTRQGGGKLPNFSGYYAELKGERWQKVDTGTGQSNIPDVSYLLCDRCLIEVDDKECPQCGNTELVIDKRL